LGGEELLELFEKALNELWSTARGPVSAITLTAIVDRVLFDASALHPEVLDLEVQDRGISFKHFRKRRIRMKPEALLAVTRLVLTEFLAIIGSITSDVLSPSLHVALAQVSLKKRGRKS
jgi:hypothetical protein